MVSSNNTTYDGTEILSINNPAFCSYLVCVSLLILKMMGVTLLTILHRMKNKAFICSEDAVWLKGEVDRANETVERVRRAYQNDLENITLFFIVGLAYLWTRPALWLINTLYIIFLAARVLHTFVYAVYVIPQPTRALLWLIGFLITGYMAIHTALYAFIALVS